MRRAAIVLALLVALPLIGQQPPSTERGFKPEKVYDFGEFDSVNPFNGNVMINIPLGDRYKVNGNVGYGFTLSYNSRVWDFERANSGLPGDSKRYRRARGSRRSNAGLGWTVSLGRLVPPDSEENETYPVREWVYESPDGAEHPFVKRLRAGDSPIDSNVGYTYDETYLRRRVIVEGGQEVEMEVEFPDGNMHVFGLPDWNVKEMHDRFGNVAGVDTITDANAINALGVCRAQTTSVWRVGDFHGRLQYVCFRKFTYDSQLKPMVDRISVTAFDGTRANYDFTYVQTDVEKPCDHEYWAGEPNPGTLSFPVLQSVTLPGGSSWQFETYPSAGQARECHQGAIHSVRLPTLGKVDYRYREWEIPIQNMCLGSSVSTRFTGGISERVLFDANGIEVGRWKYTSELAPIQLSSLNCAQPNETPSFPAVYEWFKTTVESPLGDRTESYFSVWSDPGGKRSGGDDPNGFRNDEYSRPFTRRTLDDQLATAPPFLSTSTLECTPGGFGCLRRRSTYLRYGFDPGNGGVYEPTRGSRVDLTRTVYHDDGDRYRQSESFDFDGYGHFRRIVTSATFDANNQRETFTNWNPGSDSLGHNADGMLFIPPSNPVWLLNTYTRTETTENGVTARTDFCFDAANGFLRGRRVWKGSTAGANDVVTIYSQSAGNVVEENWYGGDRAPLTTSDICTPGVGSEYQLTHTWSAGSLASSRYRGASFFSLDLTIDTNTGRVRASRDTAGKETLYAYDGLGRLTSIAEPDVAVATYTPIEAIPRSGNVAAKPAEVLVAKGTSESAFQYDWFGRVWREKTKMADGTTSVRETLYNALGWKTSVSEMEKLVIPNGGTELNFSPVAKTIFSDYDPFGRARAVTAPDGHSTVFDYSGERRLRRTVSVATSTSAETSVETTEIRDGQDRLLQVIENSAGNDAVVTTYGYDVGSRLSSVEMSGLGSVGSGIQRRFFTYDRRGFLTSEQHPELGSDGNGSTSYLDYGSRGHAHRRITGPTNGSFDLTFTFDGAERLTLMKETSNDHVVRSFAYDDPTGATYAQCAAGRCNGKLAAATRWNDFADLGPIAVTETYFYDGPGGRVSRRDQSVGTTELFAGESFRASQTYNTLGDVASITYPCRVLGSGCNASPVGDRTISYGYTNGFLTSVTGYASSITYQANGTPRTVAHTNSINDTITKDQSGMARPCSLASYGPGASLLSSPNDPCGESVGGSGVKWTSGTYEYDGAGSIKRIGDVRYTYDAFGRLSASVTGAPPNYTANGRTYDAFGNFLFPTTTTCRALPSGRIACAQSSVTPFEMVGTTNHDAAATYDAAGSVTSRAGRSFVYDAVGMMKSSTDAAGRQFRYLYSPDDERIALVERIGGANKTLWTLRGVSQQLLRVYVDDSTSGTRTWTWREDPIWRGALLLASETASGTRHYSVDHLGSPRWITGPSGTVIGEQSFDPFGVGGTADATLQFTGHERDTALVGDTSGDALDYMHARYYSGGWGRFLSVDPVLDVKRALQSPQMWNRYTYAADNPMVYTDPTGTTVYLVTYTTGNRHGDDEFKRAAETRAAEIQKQNGYDSKKDTVLLVGVRTKEDFAAAVKQANGLESQFGKVGNISLFSHSGPRDGPIFHDAAGHMSQFTSSEVGSLSVNWADNASASFYGCNTALMFAGMFTRQQGVATDGFSWYSSFSSNPDHYERIQPTGPVYMMSVAPRQLRSLGLTTPLPMTHYTPWPWDGQ